MAEKIVATYSDPEEYWLLEGYDRVTRQWVRNTAEYESFAAAAGVAQERAKSMKAPQRVIHWTKDPETGVEDAPVVNESTLRGGTDV